MFSGFIKGIFTVIIIFFGSFYLSAAAQGKPLQSRVAVVSNGIKTNIWVSDFPKKTSVIIMDTENNLLSVICTNDYGSAFLTFPVNITTGIVVKTLDDAIIVSNKAVIKNNPEDQNVVANKNSDQNKA